MATGYAFPFFKVIPVKEQSTAAISHIFHYSASRWGQFIERVI
jgi:hypothetical protein